MKKLTKTMMLTAGALTMYGACYYMYKQNNKKIIKKYETYLKN